MLGKSSFGGHVNEKPYKSVNSVTHLHTIAHHHDFHFQVFQLIKSHVITTWKYFMMNVF